MERAYKYTRTSVFILAAVFGLLAAAPQTTLAFFHEEAGEEAQSQFEDVVDAPDEAIEGGEELTEELTEEPTSVTDQYQDILDQGLVFAGICESRHADCECRDAGQCSLQDILQVFVNISIFILGISGSVLLLVLFYGGFMWVTSAGNPDMVSKGKKAIVGGIIGLVIIFGAYALVALLVGILQSGQAPGSGETLEDLTGGEDVFETGTE